MLLKEENFKIWYNEYQKQYERSTKYVKSRGGKNIRSGDMASYKDFKIDFLSEIEDNPKLSGKQIAKKMAKDELYKVSWKQAEKQAKIHVEQFGGKLSLNLIQKYRIEAFKAGEQSIWTLIKKRRQELKAEGYSSYRSDIIIGQEFFGSD